MTKKKTIVMYDTTLRDGAQTEGVSFSLVDKINIVLKLDSLGIQYIEGGFPGSNKKDMAFFKEIRSHKLKSSKVAAFGMTRRKNKRAEEDAGLAALLESGTSTVTLVGKAWQLHVKDVLKTSASENLKMISDSVAFLKKAGREVFFDAEHYFDGFKDDRDFALKTLTVAAEAGADAVILCDTNGGTMPQEIHDIVKASKKEVSVPLGIHTHNDSDLAVANSLAAVDAGCTQVQGTLIGLGERCGNANLCSVIGNLQLKKGYLCIPEDNVRRLTEVSRYIYEEANLNPNDSQPFVGLSAFAHKGGMHGDAISKNPLTYEHIEPETVGNSRRIIVSELSGAATIVARTLRYADVAKDKELQRTILEKVSELEDQGYQFEAAEASFDLLVRKIIGKYKSFFKLKTFRVMISKDKKKHPVTEATIQLQVGTTIEHTASEGDGPVDALNGALRKALEKYFPQLKEVHLIDYKVRIVNPRAGTAAGVRVVIESRDKEDIWKTIGVSENLIEASWQALVDSVEYKLMKDEEHAAS
jgi:2-isopropylmalate synthase